MAYEEKNSGQGKQIKLDIPDAPPAPDLTDGSLSAPELGDVVDFIMIDELMAKRRAAAQETTRAAMWT